MQHLSRIFGYSTKPITLTLIRHQTEDNKKKTKQEKVFINYHTEIKLRKDQIVFTDKKISDVQIETCSNIEVNEETLTFIIFIDRHGKPNISEFSGFEEYKIQFSDIKNEEIIKIFPPQFEGKIKLSIFDYETNLFKRQDGEINLRLFTFKDIRITKKVPERFKLPDFYTSNYILSSSLDKFDGSMQFFLDKQNLFFIFILKNNETKRFEFSKSLDFISFSTTYINSLGEGFFSPLEEEDFEISSQNSEDSNNSEEITKTEMLESFIANLKLSESPNKLFTSHKTNFIISDGENLGIFKPDFDKTMIKEIQTSKLGNEITKMQFNNSNLFFIDEETLKSYDLEKQELINSESKGVKDIFENTGTPSDVLHGITKDKIFQVDTRNKDMLIPLRVYRTPVGFDCANLNGEISAIGSENGDIRIYKGYEKRALIHLNGYGERCKGISVCGNFVAATYKNYIILIFGKQGNKINKEEVPEFGYPLIRKGLIGIKKLSLSLEHTLKLKINQKTFTPAVFVEGKKILSAIDNYLISWELNLNEGVDMNSKLEYIKYNLSKYSEQIISDKIIDNQVFVLFKDKIQVNNVDILNMKFD